MNNRLLGGDVKPGRVTRLFSEEEVSALLASWLDVFGRNRRGVNSKAYLWHIFSGGRYPSVAGSEAVSQYKQHEAVAFVVLSNDRESACETDIRPTWSSLPDFYVFPKNLAWTMAFTHEDGWLGPYFARHPDFQKLNDENLARIRKAREAELARLKGWI